MSWLRCVVCGRTIAETVRLGRGGEFVRYEEGADLDVRVDEAGAYVVCADCGAKNVLVASGSSRQGPRGSE